MGHANEVKNSIKESFNITFIENEKKLSKH